MKNTKEIPQDYYIALLNLSDEVANMDNKSKSIKAALCAVAKARPFEMPQGVKK